MLEVVPVVSVGNVTNRVKLKLRPVFKKSLHFKIFNLRATREKDKSIHG